MRDSDQEAVAVIQVQIMRVGIQGKGQIVNRFSRQNYHELGIGFYILKTGVWKIS